MEPGKNITLSLTINVQKRAEAELGERVGALIAMDPHDNSVLAMASFPRFDPNAFIRGLTSEEANALFNDPRQPFLNRAVLAQYPPGSTFKVVTMAAGVEKAGFRSTHAALPRSGLTWRGLRQKTGRPLTASDAGRRVDASCDPVFYGWRSGWMRSMITSSRLHREFVRKRDGIGIVSLRPRARPGLEGSDVGETWFRGDAEHGYRSMIVTATPLRRSTYTRRSPRTAFCANLACDDIGEQGTSAIQELTAEEIRPLPVSQATLDSIRYGLYLVTQGSGGTSYAAWAGASIDVAGKSGTAEDLSQGSDHVFFVAYANRSDPSIARARRGSDPAP